MNHAKSTVKRQQRDCQGDPQEKGLFLVFLVWRGDPHNIVEDPHHGEQRLQDIQLLIAVTKAAKFRNQAGLGNLLS